MFEDIGKAIGLMLVFEGIMPFLAPTVGVIWRRS